MWWCKRPVRSKAVGPALAVLFLVNVLNYYDRQTLAAILEPLRHEFSLSDTQLGGLFTLFTIVFALAGLPLGKLADRRSRPGPWAARPPCCGRPTPRARPCRLPAPERRRCPPCSGGSRLPAPWSNSRSTASPPSFRPFPGATTGGPP